MAQDGAGLVVVTIVDKLTPEIVDENATWNWVAIKPPDESPETDVCWRSTLYAGNFFSAATAPLAKIASMAITTRTKITLTTDQRLSRILLGGDAQHGGEATVDIGLSGGPRRHTNTHPSCH